MVIGELGFGSVWGVVIGLNVSGLAGIMLWLNMGSGSAIIGGLIFGFIGMLIFGGVFLANHAFSLWFLYKEKFVPWNLVAFLDYATERIFLRRVGGGYIFIHRMLMEHFAAMYPD